MRRFRDTKSRCFAKSHCFDFEVTPRRVNVPRMTIYIHSLSGLGFRCAVAALVLTTGSIAASAQGQGGPNVHSSPPVRSMLDTKDPAELLDRLFAQLNKAPDKETAQLAEQAIWNLWARSGSPSADALLQQATKAMSARSYRIATGILDTVIEIQPDFVEAWNKRATVYYLNRQYEQSLADIEKVLELEPRHFGALSGLGLIRKEMGDKTGALSAFRRALAIHPHLPSAQRAVEELEPEVEQKI